MTNLNDKEKAHENKFAHDQEVEFRIHARRDKLFGLWVAEKLGLTTDKQLEYVKLVVEEDFGEKGDEGILARVKRDLEAAGVPVSGHDLKEQLYLCQQEARKLMGAE